MIAEQKSIVPTAGEQTTAMLNVFREIALAPDADKKVEALRAIMEMQRQLARDQAERAFNEAMQKAQAEIKQVARTAKTDKGAYANLESVDNEIRHIYTKCGFSLSYDSESIDATHVRVFCHVAHNDGFSKTYKLDGALDTTGTKGTINKTELQGMGSTVSYLRRYLAAMIFNVVMRGEDNDGNNSEVIGADQVVQIDVLLRGKSVNVAKFLEWLKAPDVQSIKRKDFKRAIEELNKLKVKA